MLTSNDANIIKEVQKVKDVHSSSCERLSEPQRPESRSHCTKFRLDLYQQLATTVAVSGHLLSEQSVSSWRRHQ